MNRASFCVDLPNWLTAFMASHDQPLPSLKDRMALAIELSRLNVAYETGGPFAAVIFNTQAWTPLAAGVNMVEMAGCSILHAEIVAIAVAQRQIKHFDLGGFEMPSHELATSTEPCAMCIGAICWSGIKHLVYGACDEDARRIGFDEGPKEKKWQKSLEQRGITVTREILRPVARRILQKYADNGGLIYNARQG
jgi:tRNA(Arg) A34 adenosine deaminase TadA